MFMHAWVTKVRLEKIIVDGGSLIELVSERILPKIKATIYRDHGREISLANNSLKFINRLVYLPANVCGVEAIMKY
jgi:hypothetical protein